MAKYKNLAEFLTACMDAVRAKKGTSAKIIGEDLPDEITSIPTGGLAPVIQTLTASENKTYTTPAGVDGFNPVTVKVPIPENLPMIHEVVDLQEVSSGYCYFLRNNKFVTDHQFDPGLIAIVIPEKHDQPANYCKFLYGSNIPTGLTSAGVANYGITITLGGDGNLYGRMQKGQLDGDPWSYSSTLHIYDKSLLCSVGGTTKIAAGKYHVFVASLPTA